MRSSPTFNDKPKHSDPLPANPQSTPSSRRLPSDLSSRSRRRKPDHTLPVYRLASADMLFASSNPHGPDAVSTTVPAAVKKPSPSRLPESSKATYEEELKQRLLHEMEKRRTMIFGAQLLTPHGSVAPKASAADQKSRLKLGTIGPDGHNLKQDDKKSADLEDITDQLGLRTVHPATADTKGKGKAKAEPAAAFQTKREYEDRATDEFLDDYDMLDDVFNACEEEEYDMIKNEPQAEYNGIAPGRKNEGWVKQKLLGGRKDWMM
ncbi:hypothetical protein J1614_000409 [Plenodomus biglobosus]|nr:hypothetical protein J1614_000409 [Plenodomus biglobosus]